MLAAVAALAAACGLLALSALWWGPTAAQQPLLRTDSPDGRWQLLVTAGEAWIFGPHPAAAYRRALPAGPHLPLFGFEIANDGAVLGGGICRAAWRDAAVVVLTCEGQEQPPTEYVIDITQGRLIATTDPRLE